MIKNVKHLSLALVLLISSCGYMSDDAVKNIDVYKSDELQTCQIDVSKLGEIFKADQKAQIRCLEENFTQFTKYVKSKHPGAITEKELGLFVKRFFENQSDSIIKGLSLIFQLNMILLKDEADRISHTSISPLFQLLVEVNQEAVVLTNIIKRMDENKNPENFWKYRAEFNSATERFTQSAIGVIEKSPGMAKELNIKEFIKDLGTKIGDSDLDTGTINSFLFLKKLLIGGEEEVINTDELKTFIGKLPNLMGLIFDIYYIKSENFKTDVEEIVFYLSSIRSLHAQINFGQENFELMSSEEIVDVAKILLKNYDVDSFKPSIEALKARFIGGKASSFELNDLQTVFNIALDFTEKLYFNTITYSHTKNFLLLESPMAVKAKELEKPELSTYGAFSSQSRVDQLFDSFTHTAATFRYFRNSLNGSAFYGDSIKRNKRGFIETNLLNWVGEKLLRAYGHTDAQNLLQITMDEFSQFLLDAKPILEEFKLWSPNFTTFSRNAVLLADLFQEQSNGDQKINLNEATEYLGMLLTAVEISGKITTEMKLLCDAGINPEDPLFEPNCFNKNYFDVLLNKLGYSVSMPKLKEYVETSSPHEAAAYLEGVAGFARDDNSPHVPVNKRDITLLLGAMLNIETTFIRFDKNQTDDSNGVIDYKELSEAFLTYRNSIITLANLQGGKEKYAKSIFLYMVAYMKVPKTETWLNNLSFWSFHTCVDWGGCRGDLKAKRLNIGKLLYYMVNQGAAAEKSAKSSGAAAPATPKK